MVKNVKLMMSVAAIFVVAHVECAVTRDMAEELKW
jgi:hypothetical protein